MKLLTVPAIGTGTDADPIRPDLPAGTSFVGQHDARTGRTALSTRKQQTDEMAARQLSEAAVSTWRVG